MSFSGNPRIYFRRKLWWNLLMNPWKICSKNSYKKNQKICLKEFVKYSLKDFLKEYLENFRNFFLSFRFSETIARCISEGIRGKFSYQEEFLKEPMKQFLKISWTCRSDFGRNQWHIFYRSFQINFSRNLLMNFHQIHKSTKDFLTESLENFEKIIRDISYEGIPEEVPGGILRIFLKR